MRCENYQQAVNIAKANATLTREFWAVFTDTSGNWRCERWTSELKKDQEYFGPDDRLLFSDLRVGMVVSWHKRPCRIDRINHECVQLAPVSTNTPHMLYKHHVDGAEIITKLRWVDIYDQAYEDAKRNHPKPENPRDKDVNQDARFNATWTYIVCSGLVTEEMRESFFEYFDAAIKPDRKALVAVALICGIESHKRSGDAIGKDLFDLAIAPNKG